MPSLPAPYRIRDWRQVAKDYVSLVFDPDRKGAYLPLIRQTGSSTDSFVLPSYLGGNGPEAINCMAAVVSGTLVGDDMTRLRDHNWVTLCQSYFSAQDGVYTNNLHSRVSGSAWYDLFPNLLFYQLADRYPNVGETSTQFRRVATQWYRACVALGGRTEPSILPNFDHTGFRFETMTPVDNGHWTEPDMAAGIAWLEYMAYTRLHDPHFLTAADWCLRALERRPPEKNPLYEVLLPYGALIAARMNAELGRDYDTQKLLDWCFEAGDDRAARPGWGVIASRFGADDVYGLVGSVTDTNGYAFAMNTFEWAGALAPLARYDPRYARSIGKWLVNLASAARLFYPTSLPASQQDGRDWADANDPNGCLPYEGLRHEALRFASGAEDFAQRAGQLLTGTATATRRLDNITEDLTTAPDSGGVERLEHLWRVPVPDAGRHDLEIFSRCLAPADSPHGFRYLWAQQPEGPFRALFDVRETDAVTWHSGPLPEVAGGATIYVKAVALEGSVHETLQVDEIRVRAQDGSCAPFATGDALGWGGPSNLCLYGGSHVGLLGALVKPTGAEGVPAFDLLATDWYHREAYPTYLIYNPYSTDRRVTLPVGERPVDVYDTVTHRFLLRHAVRNAAIPLPARGAVVVVLTPMNGRTTREQGHLRVDGVIVDYRSSHSVATFDKETPR
jgi:hypothetical protein